MENRPFPIPTGEAFLVKTPYLDKIADRLYKEQQQQQLTQQNEAKLLDTEFSKNVSKLRDADIPEYTKKYQDYKNAKINLLKGKFKTNDDFIKAQLDAQRKMADWGSLGAKSIQEKEVEESYAKAVMNDKAGRYDQNAPKVLIKRRNTPLSKFKQEIAIPGTNTVVPIDLSDIDGLVKYKLGTIDFSKDWDNSIGQKTPMRIGESQPFDIEGGLQSQKKIYKGFSKTAPEVATSFLQRVVGSQKTDSLLKEHPELNDPNVLASIDSNYDKLINSDLYKEVYKGKPIEFPAWMHDTPQGKVAMYLAKQYAINNPPREELDKPVTKLKAVMDRKWDEWFKKNKITDQQKRERIRINKEGGGGFYEIDNIPLKLQQNTKSVTYINPDTKQLVTEDLVDVTDLSTAQKDDIFGKKDQYGMYVNQPFVNQGRQFLKITPDGYQGKGTFKVTPKEIIIATHKRTVGEEKPAGTGKMKVRGTAPAGNTGTKKQGEADDL
jgi:hypothetical protein